jgi:choline transport protein
MVLIKDRWTSTIAWQAGNATGVFLAGSMIQTMILINDENYAFPNWHGSLLAFAAIVISYVGAIYGSRALPYWQNAIFAIHVLAYFAWFVPIWVNAPKATHSQVWTEFSNTGGFGSMTLAVMIGQLSGISCNLGVDTAAHMSEETKDASRAVPKAMVAIYVINVLVLFPGFVTVCYHIPDLDEALADLTTYPFIYVLRQSMSTAWVTVILAVTCFMLTCSNIVYLAAVSRDLFAFARDKGMPFSNWLGAVHPRRHVPENASIITSIISAAFALIYIGSPLAFYAITSLYTVALLQCYCCSIGCVLWRRITKPETLPPAAFSLGKWGIPMNVFAVAFSLWAFFWSFWPQEYPISAAGFNWASPVFVATLIGAAVFFVFRGRKQYFGPVTEVEGRRVTR